MLLVMLLATGFYLVPPVSADTSQIEFEYEWNEEFENPIGFEFYYDVTTTSPALLFGGTEQFHIDLQPYWSVLDFSVTMGTSSMGWSAGFDKAPIGEETFRFETPDFEDQYGIEAFLISVDGAPYVKYSGIDHLSASGTIKWTEAGSKSFAVTAPFAVGEGDIVATWYLQWKVRFGLDLVGTGDSFGEWTEMDDLKCSQIQYYQIYYGFGFIFAILVAIMVIPVVLVIRRRRKSKIATKPKPEITQEPKPEIEA